MATHVYTRAELLSLRALPESARYYPHAPASVGYLFGRGRDERGVIVGRTSAGSIERAAGTLVSHAYKVLPVLRYGRGLACLNLHPGNAHDVALNELLWRSAQKGEYDAQSGDHILGANVVALVMSAQLLAFLRRVTLPELRESVLQVLSIIADDEQDGLQLMAQEVEPNTWLALQARIADRDGTQLQRTSEDVQALLQMCGLSPWKVDVYAAYVSPHDMRAVLAVAQGAQPRVRARAPSKNVVYWKLFMDWQLYRRLWVVRLNIHPADAARAMMAAITGGRHIEAWRRVNALRICCARPKARANWLAVLPKDVLYNFLAPRLLFNECAPE